LAPEFLRTMLRRNCPCPSTPFDFVRGKRSAGTGDHLTYLFSSSSPPWGRGWVRGWCRRESSGWTPSP